MVLTVANHFKFQAELRVESDLSGAPLFSQEANDDLRELVEEAFVRAVLAERLPADPGSLAGVIVPRFRDEPIVHRLDVRLASRTNGAAETDVQSFTKGRWWRTVQTALARLQTERVLPPSRVVYSLLLALRCQQEQPVRLPGLAAPAVVDQPLAALGVRRLGSEAIDPQRPVLVNARLVQDALRCCERAGLNETGGAVLGKIVRLPEPLAGAETRIVTVLTTLVEDARHQGSPLEFCYSPAALAEAANRAELRGMGETVQTVYHSHGWSPECRHCGRHCALPSAKPSLQDYQLLESLLPSKATLLPIAGRRQGTQSDRPVLEISAWHGGEMHPLAWRSYED